MYMTLGQKIKKLRVDKELTQKDIAVGLSAALAAVSFPFILIHNNKTRYEGAL